MNRAVRCMQPNGQRRFQMELVFIVIGLVLFDIAAVRWGADSRESVDSPEWTRRKSWRGFGG